MTLHPTSGNQSPRNVEQLALAAINSAAKVVINVHRTRALIESVQITVREDGSCAVVVKLVGPAEYGQDFGDVQAITLAAAEIGPPWHKAKVYSDRVVIG